MASEERRRRAGAQGVGAPATLDPTEPVKVKPKTEKTPEQKAGVLWPKVLEFRVERGVLHVPTEFTLGDVVQRGVLADFDAYCRLAGVEFAKVSGIDLSANPGAFFARDNAPYVMIALTTSNALEFMRRVLGKSAWVVVTSDDGTERSVRVADADLDQLETGDFISIGLDYLGRWIKAISEKNRARTAQT